VNRRFAMLCALAVACATWSRSKPPDIKIELEAATVDQETPDGGRRLGPEPERFQSQFGETLRKIEDPMRDCGRTQAHPAEGRAKVFVHVSPAGVVISMSDEVTPGMEAVAACIMVAAEHANFPTSDRRHVIKLESRYEVDR